jgi:lysophospholipase L1-like esterase
MRRLGLLLVAGLLAAAAPAPPAATPISRMNLAWWQARHEAKLAELRRGPVDLVFLGDSITQDFELAGPEPFRNFAPVWQRFYGDRHAVNLGFKGDATSHLLWRLRHGELAGIVPKAAIILIGANNLGHLHWSAADTVQGIAAVVDEARRRLPHTAILLLGVLPSLRNDWATRATMDIDAALAGRYGGPGVPGVTYMDVSPLFLTHGMVDTSRFFDGQLTPPEPPLHPTPEMQARIAETIEPWVSTTLGDRRRLP